MNARNENFESKRPASDAPEQPADGDAHGERAQSAAANVSLAEQLEAATSERDANYERYLRTQAELENYRKRVQREAEEGTRYQWLPVARELLPALDNLHRAISAAETTSNVEELLQGVRMVAAQIEDALSKRSVVAIEAIGKPFDPNLHEAVQQLPSAEHPPMTVLDEIERGYKLHDRVVRPSKVIVSAGPPAGA